MVAHDDTLARRLNEIERQIRDLATARRASNTTITDAAGNVVLELTRDGLIIYDPSTGKPILWLGPGGLTMYDGDGVGRTHVGRIGSGDNYGTQVFDSDGGLRFWVDNVGYHDPWLASPWRNQQTPDEVAVTSGAFISTWSSNLQLITHKGLATTTYWRTDPNTTGELRLMDGTGATTATVSLAAGSAGSQQFNWLHHMTLGTGPAAVSIQARRTGGAGVVYIAQPGPLYMADPLACDADGIP